MTNITRFFLMQLAITVCLPTVQADDNPDMFQETQSIGSLSNLSGAMADFDNDGDLDVILTNYVGPSQIWFNDGKGFFSPGEFFGLSLSFRIAVADFNGDNFPDIIYPSNGIPNSIWFNDGSGAFEMSSQSFGITTGQAATGDFDDDGDLDLFLGWPSVEDAIAVNDGTGFFSFPVSGSSLDRAIAIGDLDADGDLDAFVAQGRIVDPIGDLVVFNDGNGTFSTQNEPGLGNDFSKDVELLDIDSDGDLDAFVGIRSIAGSAAGDRIWVNDGSGTFSDSGQILGNDDSLDVETADVDADGDIDVLVLGFDDVGGHKQRVWLNDGNGLFSKPIIISEFASATQGLLGDIDGDGDADAVIITFSSTKVLKNNSVHEPGDINRDGAVNLLDVAPFVDLVSGGGFLIEADINQDGFVNLLDVALFVGLLSG